MKTPHTFNLLLPAAVLAIVLLLLAGGATPAGAGSTIYYSMLAETMSPTDSTIQVDNFSTCFLTTRANSSISGNPTGYVGQVNLPDGATITGVSCEGRDTDPENEFQVYMVRFSIDSSPVWDIIVPAFSSGVDFQGGNAKISGVVGNDHGQQIVNNAVYAYDLFAIMPAAGPGKTLGLLRCRVDATYPVALAVVRR